MKHLTYAVSKQYPVAILIKEYLLDQQPEEIKKYYVDELVAKGVPIEDIIVIGLPYTNFTKVTAATIKQAVPMLQDYMDMLGAMHVFVADTNYLKKLTKKQNLANLAGILVPSVFGAQRLFKGRVYTTYRFDDKASERVNMSLDALVASYQGTYTEKDILKEARYPDTLEGIKAELDNLLQYPRLAVDIESYDLRLDSAGVATIAFSWSDNSGVAFAVDYTADGQEPAPNHERRTLLLEFLLEYCDKGGETIYHGVSFDVKQLVANLFMKNDLLDYPAMVDGVNTLTKNHFCTKDITYLATNSAAGNTLGLKHLTLEYTGEYAIDVKNIRKHSVATVLEYNLKDTCGTFWLFNKNYPIMVARNQEELYLEHYRPNQRTLITIELTGMPLDMDEVIRLRIELDNKEKELLTKLRSTEAVKAWVTHKGILAHEKYQDSVKGDGRTLEDFLEWKKETLEFAPSQDQALVWILHEHYGLEVIDKTLISREPSVADATLEKHLSWIQGTDNPDPKVIELIEDVREYLKVTKINGTFVKAFITKSIKKKNGVYYLHGSINQGGTISGRLSSSDPNLQNQPSGGYWGKAIKKCFRAPPGYVMGGSDFNALEARIAALRTKDPNMLKVYTDLLDSHSANTFAYANGDEAWYNQISKQVLYARANPEEDFFKVTLSNGAIKYLTEEEYHELKPNTV